MGQTASSVGKAIGQPLSWLRGSNVDGAGGEAGKDSGTIVPRGVTPFVFKRRG